MAIRLSGLHADCPDPSTAIGVSYLSTDKNAIFVSDGSEWVKRETLDPADVIGTKSGLDADKPEASKMIGWIYRATDTGVRYEAFPTGWHSTPVTEASDFSFPALRQLVTGQFSQRFQSIANFPATTSILLETVGATHEVPYLVQFQQIIIDPFTGSGEFFLDESDPGDIGGESTITVATKDGFSEGYNAGIIKAITTDKIYRISFTPGDTGDGIYLVNVFPAQQEGILPPAPAIHPPLT